MKKTLLMMACLILMIACLVVPASAADAAPTVLGSSNVDLAGGTIKFTVSLPSEIAGIGSGAMAVSFDEDALEIVSTKWLVESTLLKTFNKTNKNGSFAYNTTEDGGEDYFPEGATISGGIFEITFKLAVSKFSSNLVFSIII